MNLAARKLKLIKEISDVKNEVVLKKVEALLEAARLEAMKQEKIMELAKPMRKTTNLEEIAKEKGYKANMEKLRKYKGVWKDEEESLEELLKLLTP
jgi:hypothetical protein